MTDENRKFIHDIIKIKYIREGYLPDIPYHLVSDKEMFDAFLSTISPLPKFQAEEAKKLLSNISYKKVVCKVDGEQGNDEICIMSLFPFWGDANGDNDITTVDAVRIRRYLNDNQTKICPVGPAGFTSATGRYTYVKDVKGYFVDTYLSSLIEEIALPDSGLSDFSDMSKAIGELVASIAICIASYPDVEIPYWVYSYMLGQPVGPNSDYIDIHDMKKLMGLDVLDESINEAFMNTCLDISSNKLIGTVDPTYCPTPFCDIYIEKYLRTLQSSE